MASRVSPSICHLMTSAAASRTPRVKNRPARATCVRRMLIYTSAGLDDRLEDMKPAQVKPVIDLEVVNQVDARVGTMEGLRHDAAH